MCTAFPYSDYYAPSDSSSGPWRFVGVSLAYFPLALTSLTKSPVFDVEDSNGMVEVACCWRPHPFSTAPQSPYRVGQVDLYCHDNATHCAGPYSGVAPTISSVTGWHLRQGLPGAPFPVGLCTLQVMHHVMPQPNTPSWRLVSSSGCLSGSCCSPRRVVCEAETQGLMGYLYTPRCYHILPHRFHGAQRRRSGRCRQSAPGPCSAQLRLAHPGRCVPAASPLLFPIARPAGSDAR